MDHTTNHQKSDIVMAPNYSDHSVLAAIAVLGSMLELDRAPRVYTITDPCRDRGMCVPVRLPHASDYPPRALSPAAQKIVDDARARKVANKLKTAALCRKVQQ